MSPTDCIFCRIVSGDIPGDIVHRDDELVAFRDIDPKAPRHLLIIPTRHVASVNDLTPEDQPWAGRMLLLARDLAREIGFDGAGYRLVVNTGPDGGQAVHHLHMHVLAGRPLGWPPG